MSNKNAGDWCLIESDPGVFTELIRGFGVENAEVEEIYSLDELSSLSPVYGLVFLFKWQAEEQHAGNLLNNCGEIFFARQVINNACATQAIISILMNLATDEIKLGNTLTDFKSFCQSFDPHMKGLALSNSDQIRSVHNSFARQTLFEYDQKQSSKDDDVYHFVSYLPINGRLYELDGLQNMPIDHGNCGLEWLDSVKPIIQARMSRYTAAEVHFNLMALTASRQGKLERQRADLQFRLSNGEITEDVVANELQMIEAQLVAEADKHRRYRVENVRRRFNYIPLIMEMLKLLAQRGQLLPLVAKAKKRAEEKLAAAKNVKPME